MVNYARIQAHIDRGKGIAAKKLGPQYAAFRLVSWATGDFPNGWGCVNNSFALFRRRLTAENKFDLSLTKTTLWQDIIADMSPFIVGDVFLSIDPPYQAGVSYGDDATQQAGSQEFNGICLAYHPPVGKAVGARVDRLAQLYRPATSPGSNPEGSLSWKATLVNDQPLVLEDGVYALQAAGSVPASMIPVGLSAIHRKGDSNISNVPAMTKPQVYFFYVPPLPGYLPREGDALVEQNGARYVVTSAVEQTSGVAGYQLICDRKVDSPG